MGSITYTATKLHVPGKLGVIKKGADGWYPNVPMGALGCFNSGGAFYLYEESKAAFENSTDFMRKAREGCLYSEVGHPRMTPGMSTNDFMMRARDVVEANWCNALTNVTLTENGARDQRGQPICLITADVKPYGVHAHVAQEALEDPRLNLCYSIRCITMRANVRGMEQRAVAEVINFDLVGEPGLYEAKKRYSPSLESMLMSSSNSTDNEFEINTSVIKLMQARAKEMSIMGVSVESADKLNDFSLRLESYYKRATTTAVPFVFGWTK